MTDIRYKDTMLKYTYLLNMKSRYFLKNAIDMYLGTKQTEDHMCFLLYTDFFIAAE